MSKDPDGEGNESGEFNMQETMTGNFRVQGNTAGGKSFRGVSRIEETGAFYRLEVKLDGARTLYGLGRRQGNVLAFAVGPKDKVEIAVYQIEGDQLRGLWVPPDAKGDDLSICGREHSVRSGANEFTIKEARSITGEAYTGRITIEEQPGKMDTKAVPVKMTWHLNDGVYHAVGIKQDTQIFAVFSFEPEAQHGVVVYTMADEGYQGVWVNNEGQMGVEVLMSA
jgi:hypothetical protein